MGNTYGNFGRHFAVGCSMRSQNARMGTQLNMPVKKTSMPYAVMMPIEMYITMLRARLEMKSRRYCSKMLSLVKVKLMLYDMMLPKRNCGEK